MSNSISGGISFSGIGSGTDFTAMIEQLKEVESIRLYSLEDSREVANESYEAYQELLDTIAEAQEALGNLNSPSKFLTKIAASSDEATLGVKADAEAVDGTHKIEVKQLASNAIWASTHNFDEKTTVINTTSTPQNFTYTYMGTERTLAVPPGTTLEGFANMLNEDKANPGVKMSMIKTADGYTFQIAGKDSGAGADLQILPSNLLGMSGSSGSWQSSASVDLDKALNDGQSVNTYQYTLTFNDGSSFTTRDVAGDASQQDIVDAINEGKPGTASIDSTGKMVINDLRSLETTTFAPNPVAGEPPIESSTESKVTPTTSFTVPGTLTDRLILGAANYIFTNADNESVNVSMSGDHTQHDILNVLNGMGYKVSAKEEGGNTTVDLSGITNADAFLGTEISTPSVSTLEAFSAQGPFSLLPAQEYTFVNDAGGSFTVNITTEHTIQSVLDAINANGYKTVVTTPADPANPTGIAIEGLSNFDDFYTAVQGASAGVSAITESVVFGYNGDLAAPVADAASYTFKDATGADLTIAMPANHTMQGVLDELQAQGHAVSVTGPTSGQYAISIAGISNVDDFISTDTGRIEATTTWPSYTQAIDTASPVQSGIVPQSTKFTFTMTDGSTQEVDVTNDQTLREVLTGAGISFTEEADGKLTLNNVASVTGVPASVGLNGGATSSDVWAIQASQDAIFKVDNWPQDLTSSTNEVSDVLEGVTLTLRNTGTAQITIASDTDSVKDNIQTVLDAVNSVLKKIQDLTAITEDVSPTYDEYGNAGMDTTDGAALTGDYSVQAFASRLKDNMGNYPPGFQPMSADDIFSGDFISSLALMGIKVSSDLDSEDYGLFSIAPHGTTTEIQAFDQSLFDDAIENHLEDVIDFFSSDGVGTSSSPNFRYANHITGLTEPGTYDVSYDVDMDGNAYNVMINGVAASASDTQPNTFSVASAGDASGMSIVIDNLTQGSYTGSVSVQQGKVNQMVDFFMAELKYVAPTASDPSLGNENGALMIAKESYAEQIRSYDEQISSELERLERWETTEKLKFARLDTLLGDYNGNMAILTNQLAQLG